MKFQCSKRGATSATFTSSIAALSVFGLALAACSVDANKHPSTTAKLDAHHVHDHGDGAHSHDPTHAKNAAPIALKEAVGVTSEPGEVSQLSVVISEGYDAGEMTLEARASDGLELESAGMSSRRALADQGAHDWQVRYSAETAGLYYIHITAYVVTDGQPSQARAFSVPIQVGDVASPKLDLHATKLDPDTGEAMVVMELEETISRED